MPIQTAFNSGEFSDLMDGAIDYVNWSRSCKSLENMIALKQGPATRRGPTIHVNEVKDSANRTTLIRFQFNSGTNYQIEVGDQYFRFYKNRAQIKSAGTPVEISTPYTIASLYDANNLFQLQFAQSGDVLFIVGPGYAPRVLTRTSDTSWTLSTLTIEDGPYLDTNGTATTLGLSSTSGSVTVTASSATGINGGVGFATTDVGRLIRWKDSANNWTWLTITAWTSTTQVTATISGPNASATTATVNWRLGVWSATTGYPVAISFFQERLAMGGAASYPDRVDLSKTGGFSSVSSTFQPTNPAGTVADDNAITVVMPSGQINGLRWLASDLKGLIAGTSKEEFLIRSTTFGESMTPTNKTVAPFSSTGSAYIQPVRTVFGTSFIQAARRRLFDIVYSSEQDSLVPIDTTLAAEHITRSGIIATAYQQEPINVLWTLRNDGVLAAVTHYPTEKVWGWHRHIIGGHSDAADTQAAVVESISCIPEPGGTYDELWLVVRRNINGTTKRYIEYMQKYYESDMNLDDAGCCDSRFTYDSTPTNTVSGLGYLEGETVKVMVDGKSHPNLTVSSGAITLANGVQGSTIQVGLSYSWKIVTNRIEVKTKDLDTAQGKIKRITNVTLRVLNAKGLYYGDPNTSLSEYTFEQATGFDETIALFTGDVPELPWPGSSNREGQMQFGHDGVFPFTMVALISEVQANK
jgi:hypothetical protein